MRVQRIRHRMLWVVLLAMGWSIALSVPAMAAMEPGVVGDSVMDLVLDVTTGNLSIYPDGVTINGYVFRSAGGIFTGAPANNLGWFTEDTANSISGNMGFTLDIVHNLGNVIGPEWVIIDPYDFYYDDLTGTYNIVGAPGTHVANLIIIPEPTTVALLALGSLVALRRKRR